MSAARASTGAMLRSPWSSAAWSGPRVNEPVQRGLSAATQAIAFTLNGAERIVTAAPARRLSDVLRDALGLTGTKVGCNAGDCGACTVLVDGRQVCACLTAVAQVAARCVTTIEG